MAETLNWTFERLDGASSTLHGLRAGKSDDIVIHLHGTWGNFYENTIATQFADLYASHGYSFATVNLPGHDGESMTEDFNLSIAAVSAWIEKLSRRGRIVLQAHSLGALKAIRYLTAVDDRARRSVVASVLLAPFDLRAFYAQSADDGSKESKRQAALTACAQGRAADLVDASYFGVWPITNETYAEALKPGGTLDVFPTSTGEPGLLAQVQVPTFVAVGGADFAATPSPEVVIDIAGKVEAVRSTLLVPDAPHNFAGSESVLERGIASFMDAI